MGYPNFHSYEGTASTAFEINFPLRGRMISLMNDSATTNLQFKFHSGDDYGTLLPTETLSTPILNNTIFLNSTGAPYRCWVWG